MSKCDTEHLNHFRKKLNLRLYFQINSFTLSTYHAQLKSMGSSVPLIILATENL